MYQISKILKAELGEEYDRYNLRRISEPEPQKKEKIVALRKQYIGLGTISSLVNVPIYKVKEILLEEIGYTYSDLRPDSHQSIAQRHPQDISTILRLRASGKAIAEISDVTGLTEGFIKWVISERTEEELSYRIYNQRCGIQSEDNVLQYLHQAYILFAKELLAVKYDSKRIRGYNDQLAKFKALKSRCVSHFLKFWRSLNHTIFKSPDVICPPFLYAFFKAHLMHPNWKVFMSAYEYNRARWNKALTRIYHYFPHYLRQDRKQLILGIIKEIQASFNLGSQFYTNARLILRKLWKYLHNTRNNVLAGTVFALSLFSINNAAVPLRSVCRKIGVSQSSLSYQVKTKLFDGLKIDGFKSLVMSQKVIREKILKEIVQLQLSRN